MNLGKIFNIGLVVAVLILYLLQFSSFKGSNSPYENTNTENPEIETSVVIVDSLELSAVESLSVNALVIGYVNIDSLNLQYTYLKDAEKSLIRQSEREQKKLQTKAEQLQKEYMMFVENVQSGLVDQQKAMEMDQVYKNQQMKLMEDEQKAGLRLDKKRQEVNEKVMSDVTKYLDTYANANDYDLILAYGRSSEILYAKKKYDITSLVIDGLNMEYKAK